MTTVTIGQKSGCTYTGCEDAYIEYSTYAAYNFGTNSRLLMYCYPTNSIPISCILMKFSGLSNIPTIATIHSATLYLVAQATAVYTETLVANRLLRNWGEGVRYQDIATTGESSWNCYAYPNTWATAGAKGLNTDIASVDSFNVSLDISQANHYYAFTGSQFVTDIQEIVRGNIPNYGWRIRNTAEANGWLYFASSNNYSSYKPYLEVNYGIYNDPSSFSQFFGQGR